eukprot:COSAG06_NODE_1343_length_9787_cov_18.972853_1_plen_125_part_00
MQCVYVVTDDTGGDCNTGLCVSTALLSEVCSASCLDQQKAELGVVPSVQGPASAGGRRAGSSPRRSRAPRSDCVCVWCGGVSAGPYQAPERSSIQEMDGPYGAPKTVAEVWRDELALDYLLGYA